MKNTISLVINGVLVIAVLFLYVLHFSGKKDSKKDVVTEEQSAPIDLSNAKSTDIVYVDIDSLLLHYRLSEDLNDAFLQKQENLKSEFSYKARKLEEDVVEFQKKLNRGGFLTQQRAEDEQQKLLVRQQELQNLEIELSNRLMVEQQEMTNELYDSIVFYVEHYNKKYNYTYILGNSRGGGLLYANKGLNITGVILEGLNARYLAGNTEK